MAIYGNNTVAGTPSWKTIERRRAGISITLTGTETALKISAYLRSQGSATGGVSANLYNEADDTLAYSSSILSGFTDTTGQWRDFTFTDSVAAGTYWLTVIGDAVAGGANTIEIAHDTVAADASLYEFWFWNSTAWPDQDPDLTGLETGEGNTHRVSLYLETASGSTVHTEQIDDTLTMVDSSILSALHNRQISDAVTIQAEDEVYREFNYELSDTIDMADSQLLHLVRSRMLSDGVTLLELVTALYVPAGAGSTVNTATITDTLAITDALTRLLDFNRQVNDTVTVADLQILSSVFNRNIEDTVTVIDEQILQLAWTKVLADQLDLLDSPFATYLPDVLYDVAIVIGSTRAGMPVLGGY